ncbi:MAG: hypothetical protein FIA97_12950 [Methylococcaceae bacterium]|nr:hypothetical protein [Methylococcaceae bacterium]
METFLERILGDPGLQVRLREITDRREFVAVCLAISAELGLALDETELQQAMQAGRRAWLERHLL